MNLESHFTDEMTCTPRSSEACSTRLWGCFHELSVHSTTIMEPALRASAAPRPSHPFQRARSVMNSSSARRTVLAAEKVRPSWCERSCSCQRMELPRRRTRSAAVKRSRPPALRASGCRARPRPSGLAPPTRRAHARAPDDVRRKFPKPLFFFSFLSFPCSPFSFHPGSLGRDFPPPPPSFPI